MRPRCLTSRAQYDHATGALAPETDLLLPLPAPAIDAAFAPQEARCLRRCHVSWLLLTWHACAQESVLATAGDALRVWRLRDGASSGTAAAAGAAKAGAGAEPRLNATCSTLRGVRWLTWHPLPCVGVLSRGLCNAAGERGVVDAADVLRVGAR
jgi:hypothetical protein